MPARLPGPLDQHVLCSQAGGNERMQLSVRDTASLKKVVEDKLNCCLAHVPRLPHSPGASWRLQAGLLHDGRLHGREDGEPC